VKSKPVELEPSALEEMRLVRIWYAQRSPIAADRFVAEVDRAIEEIATNPDRWPAHLYGTRRILLHRFPYLIVYRIEPAVVKIIACQHGRQRPGYWRERTKK
jgi:plasmid stabilization system protein ParE